MPDKQIQLSADEARIVTPFFYWAEGFAAGLEAAKSRMLNDVINARIVKPPVPKETPDGNPI